MIFLVKSLYVRQKLLNLYPEAENIILTEESLLQYKIEHYKDIMRFYFSYDTFSEHIVLDVVVKLFIFVKTFSNLVGRYDSFLMEKNENILLMKQGKLKENIEETNIWMFLNKIVTHIEIVKEGKKNKEGPLGLIYFKKLPKCFFLTNFEKMAFANGINIESYESKLEDFFNSVTVFSIQSSHLLKSYKQSQLLFLFSGNQFIFIYKVILYCIAVVLNLLFLLFWDHDTKSFNNHRGDATLWVMLFSILDSCFAFICLASWLYLKVKINYKINREEYIIERQIPKSKLKFYKKVFYLILYKSIIVQDNFQSFFCHTVFPILGLTVSPIFFTLLLPLIIHISQLLFGIILCFMENLQKLFFTFLIILVFITVFSYYLA